MNVLQKLAQARKKFLAKGIEKSGVNQHLEFKYFRLEDIVPEATEIFAEIGLLHVFSIKGDVASMIVYNTDDINDFVEFTAPFIVVKPIINKEGKQVSNDVADLGSSITYLRRYLYLMCLDIVEADEIDANLKSPEETEKELKKLDIKTSAKKEKPKNEEEKKEIVKELTNQEEQADALQIKALKTLLKELKTVAPDKKGIAEEITIKTNLFKNVSKKQCAELIDTVAKLVQEVKND